MARGGQGGRDRELRELRREIERLWGFMRYLEYRIERLERWFDSSRSSVDDKLKEVDEEIAEIYAYIDRQIARLKQDLEGRKTQ